MRGIAAVIVTHNRRDLLRDCVRAVREQTRWLDRVLVVDNASSDGTAEMLREEFPDVETLPMARNQGSAGGFHEGLKAAFAAGAEWTWLLDDDSAPRPDALERLLAGVARAPEGRPPVLAASRVEWHDGRAHPMNQPIVKRRDTAELLAACERGLLPLRTATFVGLLVHADAVRRHGLPDKAFFYQADDIEFTARLLRTERGYAVPDSIVEHRTATAHDATSDGNAGKFFHHARNTVYMLRGTAWEPRERPALAWVLVDSSLRFLKVTGYKPHSAWTIVRAIAAGLRAAR